MPSRIERLLSLLNLLIGADRAITAERIRDVVPGYPEEHASFQRQFERDKAELRAMGLPLETGEVPGSYPPVTGYRIRREDALLRDPGLDPDELAALQLASSAVRLEGIEGSGGLWKLGGGGPAPGGDGIADLPADDRLVALFGAVAERRRATFRYNDADRDVEPWRLDCTRGRWYLTGHDHARGGSRNFRVDRIDGPVQVGPPQAFERPAHAVEPIRMEAWRFGGGPAATARLLVDADHLPSARQAAPSATMAEQRPDGSAVLEVEVTNVAAFRSLVLGFLDHAEVLSPPELRADVVAWLTAIADGAGEGAA